MALNFRLFNCDRTFNLDKVEALIQRVATKISRETKIEKTYFPLPRMKEFCEELEKEGSHFEYAVFVVHAHESRLSINERSAGIGYAKVYRALQKVTGDRVLIVIGGDDNYKGQEECDKSVLSRWVLNKIFSQFTEDYVNGEKSFVFSWEEDHHPIHEEALEFYLDPTKKGTQFVPRPRPPPVKVPAKDPEKEVAKTTEQAKVLKLMKQESQAAKLLEQEILRERNEGRAQRIEQAKLLEKNKHDPQTAKTLKQEFPPERNENRPLPPKPETRTKGVADPLQKENQMESRAGQYQDKQASATSGTPDVHILSFHAPQPSVDGVVNLFERVYKEHGIASKPKSSPYLQINIQDHIKKYKPQYLVLVSEFDNIEDMPNLDKQDLDYQAQLYKDIVKMSSRIGTKLTFIVTQDKKYREGYMSSDAVHNVFTRLNQDIPRSEQPMVLSWNKTPWPSQKEALVELLTPYGNVKRAAPQQYGATKQDPTSRVPYTQPVDIPRRFYRASISYGRVVKVLETDPPDWLPDSRSLNDLLLKNQSVKTAIIELWHAEDGNLQSSVRLYEAKLSKIAEGVPTDRKHSILVYSYHAEEETNKEVGNLIHYSDAHVLLPRQPIESVSLLEEITCVKPDYVMFSVDADVLEDEDEVKLILRHETKIRDVIEKCVGQGVIIMLFGDKYYTNLGDLASKEATENIGKLTKGIIEPGRLDVLTCQDRPYTTHQEWMKTILNSKGAKKSASQGAVALEPSKQHYYKGAEKSASQGAVALEPSKQHYYKGAEKSASQGAVALEPSKQHYFKAVIKSGQITKLLAHKPPDWKPDEGMVRKKLQENKNLKKAYLEIFGNEKGEILKIAVQEKSSFWKKLLTNPTSLLDSDDENSIEEEYA